MTTAAEARQRIEVKHREIEGADPFDVLGVPPTADDALIKQAYFGLAREFHADAFAGVDLGPSQATLDTVFAVIADAYATLTDPQRRGEYDAGKAIAATGMTTDVAALLDAEQDFTKGKMILERGDIRASIKYFEQSAPLNLSNLEWQAHMIFAQWFAKRDVDDAKARSVELEKLYKQNDNLLDTLVFAARMAMEGGDYGRAHKLLGKALGEQPKHTLAKQTQRNLLRVEEQERKANRGFFARFFGKK